VKFADDQLAEGRAIVNTIRTLLSAARMFRTKPGCSLSPERGQQKRYGLCLQLKAILGSWHSTTELLPLAFIFNDFQGPSFALSTIVPYF